MVVGYTITYAISAYHHLCCEFESHSWRDVLDITLCDKVCQWLSTGQWFSLGTLVFSTNKTDHHDITEILLKVALSTITAPIIDYIDYIRTELYYQSMMIWCITCKSSHC